MAIINIGILAHVDAGKTSLTERILYQTGVIASPGNVDKGTTQTDTLALERAHGITIKSAVASFELDGLLVNLIDTPGHADFVAEVERSLSVLDGVVLVISAVEGVQPQTVKLARAVHAAGLPLLIFINKVDRTGARGSALLEDIQRRLRLRVVPMNSVLAAGARDAAIVAIDRADPSWRNAAIDLMAESNDQVIDAFERGNGQLRDPFFTHELRTQVSTGALSAAFFGSARTGVGVEELLSGLIEWLSPACADEEGPMEGRVFKIIRPVDGEKVAYVRLFAGRLAARQRVTLHRPDGLSGFEQSDERITAIERFEAGTRQSTAQAGAGEIVALLGLKSARIGDWLGEAPQPHHSWRRAFADPAFESIVRPLDPGQASQLHSALRSLAEQDPLISLRQSNEEISVSLYGEVQKEILTETLAQDYGIGASFGPSRIVCVERPAGPGEYAEVIGHPDNPFMASVGFRIEPGEIGSGIRYHRELGSLPLAFYRAIEESVRAMLTQGIAGWRVTDSNVTLIAPGFDSVMSTAGDFRKLTPLVLGKALLNAGTIVCEPVETLELDIPQASTGAVISALARAGAEVESVAGEREMRQVTCEIPTAQLRGIEQQLPRLTSGEGSWLTHSAGYAPVVGIPPERARIGPNPFNRIHYLAEISQL